MLSSAGRRKKGQSNLQFEKYELFALKLLKLCVEQLQSCNCRGDGSAALLEAGSLCFKALQLCGCSGKAPPLSCEKMLLHFASQCFNRSEHILGVGVCEALHAQLRTNNGGEGESLLKHTYHILWKAALEMEQHGATLDTARLCLHLRRVAFQCLLCTQFELSSTLERVVKADVQFQKLALSATNQERLPSSALQELCLFHTTLLHERDLLAVMSPLTPCRNLAPCLHYLLHLAKLHIQLVGSTDSDLGSADTVAAYLERVQTLTSAHMLECSENEHGVYEATAHVLQLSLALRISSDRDLVELFLGASICLESVAACCHDLPVSALGRLTDSVEFLVSILKDPSGEGGTGDHSSAIPRGAFPSLIAIVMAHSQLVECQLQTSMAGTSKALEQNARSRQLSLLSLPSQLLRSVEDECEEIETPRGRASSAVSTSEQPLAALCLPLLKAWQAVLCAASKGLLDREEHRWLGNEAYNVGLSLFRTEHYSEAAVAVVMACWELGVWCGEEGEGVTRERRTAEVSSVVGCL